jgi:hypothetical protein
MTAKMAPDSKEIVNRRFMSEFLPFAAIIMVPIIGKEGVEALQGKTCCDGAGCH